MEAWASGQFTSSSTEGTAQLNAEALGRVGAIQQLLDLDFSEMCGGSNE